MLAQAADHDLAQQDHDCRIQAAERQPAEPGHHHQGGADQQLVGDRVEHPAEIGELLAGAGDVAVEIVRDTGCDEDQAGEQIGGRAVCPADQPTRSGIAAMRDKVNTLGRSVSMGFEPRAVNGQLVSPRLG